MANPSPTPVGSGSVKLVWKQYNNCDMQQSYQASYHTTMPKSWLILEKLSKCHSSPYPLMFNTLPAPNGLVLDLFILEYLIGVYSILGGWDFLKTSQDQIISTYSKSRIAKVTQNGKCPAKEDDVQQPTAWHGNVTQIPVSAVGRYHETHGAEMMHCILPQTWPNTFTQTYSNIKHSQIYSKVSTQVVQKNIILLQINDLSSHEHMFCSYCIYLSIYLSIYLKHTI